MKKHLIFSLAVAGMMSLASCQSEEPAVNSGDEMVVSFSAQIPDKIQSRSFGDGTTATKLKAFAYQKQEDGSYVYVAEEDAEVTGLNSTVSFKLMKGETYKFAFWAQAEGAPYTFDAENAQVEMNYSIDAEGNNESRDAFFGNYQDIKVDQSYSDMIVFLYRPFAQLNIAASDYETASKNGYVYKSAKITAQSYSAMNLLTGEAQGDIANVEFDDAEFPDAEFTDVIGASSETYKYLSMNYLLLNDKQELINIDMEVTPDTEAEGNKFSESKSYSYKNIPVCRNYRTNIYGALFTESLSYNVSIKKDFYEPSFDNFVGAETAEQLKAAIKAGSDVVLLNDISVDNISVTSGQSVIIDIQDHTLTIDSSDSQIVSNGSSLTIRNGNVVNEKVTGTDALFGVVDGSLIFNNATVKTQGCAIFPTSSSSSVQVLNGSSIEAGTFAIATNSRLDGGDAITPYIKVYNSSLSAATAIMIDVPASKVDMYNSTVTGTKQAAVFRCGEYVLQSNTFILDLPNREGVGEEDAAKYVGDDAVWGYGNEVPVAAVVMGNHNDNIYQYRTYVKAYNTSINYALVNSLESGEQSYYYNVYAYANQTTGLGVIFATVPGFAIAKDDQGRGLGIKWASDNILKNGKTSLKN